MRDGRAGVMSDRCGCQRSFLAERSAATDRVAGALEELAGDTAILHDAHLLELRVHLAHDARHET